ncbi:hypothetical protein [Actibacterium pelagium]|uniref:Uncharacterized protein n=1 Tax=Actibacterium pelagium TaxID=2029103 RepID=A0A917EII0_9RHOB|nr:hypothetical protein [Actibacterium pelagium]GGE46790.1 hypothetical protein GCM10011517_13160 [Actibacterium pelagium]
MKIYEASLKTKDPATGNITMKRLVQMEARSSRQVERRVQSLGLANGRNAELVVYAF